MSRYSALRPNYTPKSSPIYFLLIGATVAALLFLFVSCQQRIPLPSQGGPIQYTTYFGPSSGPSFAFDGPKGWRLAVHEPDNRADQCKYWSLTLYGPTRPRGTLSPFLVVEALPSKRNGGCVDSLDEILRNYQLIASEHQRIDSAASTVINGASALQIVVRGETRDLNEGVPAGEPYPSANMVTAIDGAGYIYTVDLHADPTELENYYLPVYDRAVSTLRLGQK